MNGARQIAQSLAGAGGAAGERAAARELSLARPAFSWPLLLGVAAFVLIAVLGSGLADQDVFLHVAVGRWILGHGHVPTHDPFSFTRREAPWVAQEWGSELLSVLAYRLAGWAGLVFLGAASFGATLAYLMRFLLRRMQPLHALVLGSLAASMLLQYVVDRPYEFVWPLTVLWIGGLLEASEQRRAPSWWLLGVMLLWVNMHASFILGLGLMLLLALDSAAGGGQERVGVARRWGPFCAAAFAVALVNPQGFRLLLFPFHVLDIRIMMKYFKDWRPPDLQHLQPLDLWLLVVVGAAFAGRIRLSLVRAVTVLVLLFMALEHYRNIALLGMLSPFLLATPVAASWPSAPRLGEGAGALDRWFHALSPPARAVSVWVTLVLACALAVGALRAENPQPPALFAPRAALAAILSRVPKPRILNDVNFGDYLIYRGVPVFVDARADLYGEAFLKETFDAMSLAPDGHIQRLSAKYRVNAILIMPILAVARLLARLPGWRCVYKGKWAVAYVRRAGRTP